MEICIIHGGSKNGNTDGVIEIIKAQLNTTTSVTYTDIYPATDLPVFCTGCTACLATGEYGGQNCPHKKYTHAIMEKLYKCDGFILASPCYALGESAQVKNLLDHLACIYLSHRPNEEMFNKIAFIVANTGWAGSGKVMNMIKSSVMFWGVKRIITCKITMQAHKWEDMPKRKKIEMDLKKKTTRFYTLLKDRYKIAPGLSNALLRYSIKMSMKKRPDSDTDKIYWKSKRWI